MEIEVQPLDVPFAERASETVVLRSSDFLSRRRVKTGLFMLGDLCALSAAYVIAAVAATTVFGVAKSSLGPPLYPFFFVPFCAAVFYLMDGYGMPDLRRPEREVELSFKAVSFSLLSLLAANAIVLKGEMFSRYFVLLWYFFALGLVPSLRFALRGLYSWAWWHGRGLNRALFIGQGRELQHFQELLSVQRHKAYHLVAAIIPDLYGAYDSRGSIALSPDSSRWESISERQTVQVVILGRSLCNSHNELFREILASSCRRNLDVTLFADTWYPNGMHRQLDSFTGSSYLSTGSRWNSELQQFCKRCLDIVFGVIGSLITLALAPIIGLLINLEDRGPIFHLREFVGSDGDTRHYRKFRTMVQNADEILQNDPELRSRFANNHKLRDDPRVLRIGRFLRKYSIDEFPQFFSLLTGHLSLVGPRVISRAEKDRYGSFLSRRLSVKPGMTGYWQVMGRQTTTYDERIQMDEFYLNHWSIWLDLYIVAKTFGKLIWPEGAY